MHTVLALTVVTTGVGYLMVRVGLGKGMLQLRRASRRCPSCGRLIDGSRCRVCTGQDR
jgi:recombinational DNA repair protein RecR